MPSTESLSNQPSLLPVVGKSRLGVLSIHLDGQRCRVGCEFCYLAARDHDADGAAALDPALLADALGRLDYDEVAVAISEPAARWLPSLRVIVRAAAARDRPVAITTTAAVLAAERGVIDGVSRVSLSIDPRKGPVIPAAIDRVAASVRAPGREVALVVTLVSPAFAAALLDGALAALVALPHVDKVALHGLKPPPDWCDSAFWLAAFARLAPLLERHLDRRLFLDCYVAARILSLGGCPARPDLSPGRRFRACVYQPAADFTFSDAADLSARLADFVAPSVCPFPIR